MQGRGLFCGALLALVCSAVMAQEPTVDAIRARILEQEARLYDMQAKMSQGNGSAADSSGLVSIRKNAVVTVGGLVTTGYYYQNYKVSGHLAGDGGYEDDIWRTRAKEKDGSLEISDAEVYLDIQVNDHVDAFLYMDLQNQSENYSMAKAYWVRWKDICNTGFGIKVGRDRMVFGDDSYGYLDSWINGAGDGVSWMEGDHFTSLFPVLMHNGRKFNGVTQITPYWEGLDGKVKAELSFMQNIDNIGNRMHKGVSGSTFYVDKNGRTRHYRSRNYGLGTMSARVTVAPIEGLQLSGSFVNFHSNGFPNGWWANPEDHDKNNSATAFGFGYRPCFLSKLNLWGQWVHGWNVSNLKDLDSDVVNLGVSWDIVDDLTFFVQGDYVRSKWGSDDMKNTAWAAYTGLIYNTDSGLILEAGWRHEQLKFKTGGVKLAKVKGDTIYANIGFEF